MTIYIYLRLRLKGTVGASSGKINKRCNQKWKEKYNNPNHWKTLTYGQEMYFTKTVFVSLVDVVLTSYERLQTTYRIIKDVVMISTQYHKQKLHKHFCKDRRSKVFPWEHMHCHYV